MQTIVLFGNYAGEGAIVLRRVLRYHFEECIGLHGLFEIVSGIPGK